MGGHQVALVISLVLPVPQALGCQQQGAASPSHEFGAGLVSILLTYPFLNR